MLLWNALQGRVDAAETARHENNGKFSPEAVFVKGGCHALREFSRYEKRRLVARDFVEHRVDGRSVVDDQRDRSFARGTRLLCENSRGRKRRGRSLRDNFQELPAG